MPISYETFAANLAQVRKRILTVCQEVDRDPASVFILPITKSHPATVVGHAIQAGLNTFGENRIQEAVQKIPEIQMKVAWELVGHLQSNKAKTATQYFARIQSVDSQKLVDVLDAAAAAIGRKLPILLQINTAIDPAKFGADPRNARSLVTHALGAPNLRVDGFMTIAPLGTDPLAVRRTFCDLRRLRDELQQHYGIPFPELSMGMSGDFEDAIREGSTIVRLGTVLFARRAEAQTAKAQGSNHNL